MITLLALWIAACTMIGPVQGAQTPTVVQVRPGETLNQALSRADGDVALVLPAGVTEYTAPIERAATVVIVGKGERQSVLRAAADVRLVNQREAFDGDFILRDLTHDRAHRTGGPRDGKPGEGPNLIHTAAGGRVEFRNVTMEHFDFGGRAGEIITPWNRPDEVAFHNVTMDFSAGVTRRHASGKWDLVMVYRGDTDRLIVDEACAFLGHLTQHVDPATVEVHPPHTGKGPEGPAGHIAGFGGKIYDYALIDGLFLNWDYGVWRTGGPAAPNAVLEFRCDDINAGMADQFWPRCEVDGGGGHVIYNGVHITSAPDNRWHDRGIKTMASPNGALDTVTITGCVIHGRIAPIHIQQGVRQLTISDVTMASRDGGILVDSDWFPVDSVKISNIHITPHPDVEFFKHAIRFQEAGHPFGPMHMVSDVLAIGYTQGIVLNSMNPDSEVILSNVRGIQHELDLPAAEILGVVPRGRLEIDGRPAEAADRKPVTSIAGGGWASTGELSGAEVYMTWSNDGLDVLLVVSDPSHGGSEDPGQLYKKDDVQFGVATGRPGEADRWAELDFGLTPAGPAAFLREYPAGVSEVVDIPLAIVRDEAKKQTVYEAHLPWGVLGITPPFDTISVDVAISNRGGQPPHGFTSWDNPYDNGEEDSGIYFGKDHRAYKWLELEGPTG